MKKLIKGIIDFKKNATSEYKQNFSKLALGQSPDALLVTCSDSRVAPNVFASTNPGDLFVVRNVGNLIPPSCNYNSGHSQGCESAAAAIEYALLNLNVSNIIICGHSECGAMQSIMCNCSNISSPNLKEWLKFGFLAKEKLNQNLDSKIAPHNQLSKLNVLEQLNHLKSYPIIQERINENKLKIHGWWFDIAAMDVYYYNKENKDYSIIDEKLLEQFN
jgi:carbonic anhydrase